MAAWLLVLLLVLFGFVDVWYFVRVFCFILKTIAIQLLKKTGVQGQKPSLTHPLRPVVLHGVVFPSDVDNHMHMNNSKYLREMDFGRLNVYLESGLLEAARKFGAVTLVAAISIRYRKSLQLWERFTLKTRILHWSKDAFYLEQQFINKDGFTCAVAMVKMVAKSKGGRIPPGEVFKLMAEEGETTEAPPTTPELKCWIESLEKSSESMKKEQLSNSQNGKQD